MINHGYDLRIVDMKWNKDIPEASVGKIQRKSFSILMVLSFILTSGCMKMGPDFQQPDSQSIAPASYQQAQESALKANLDDPWWEDFGDPALTTIVEEALSNNLDIKRTTSRVLEVRSQFIQSRAARLPQVDFRGEVNKRRATITTNNPRPSSSRLTIDGYDLTLPASFEVDLWGRLARSEEASRADLLQAEENRRTIAQTVVADTISLYFQIESLERRIQITNDSIQTFRISLEVAEGRYRRGLRSVLDVRQARRLLAQTEAVLPNLREDLGVTQQRLAVLLGRYPRTRPANTHPPDYFKMMAPVPPGIPSDILKRRPDIRASEASLKALNARVGVAKASRFPRLALTGSLGYSSVELNDLLDPSSELRRIALGLAQPLFDGGELQARQRAAEARYQQGLMNYAKNLLNAFAEVERALLGRQEQLARREKLLVFLAEARAAQEVAESRYLRGLVSYLNVLDAQQSRFTAEQNVVQVDLSLLVNRVNLYRALGGGWGYPGPADPDKDLYKIKLKEYLL
jgi:multidrug efflux system outer membrane protein